MIQTDDMTSVGVFNVAPVGGHDPVAQGQGKPSRVEFVRDGQFIDPQWLKRAEPARFPGFFRLQLGSTDGGHAVVAVHEDAVFVLNCALSESRSFPHDGDSIKASPVMSSHLLSNRRCSSFRRRDSNYSTRSSNDVVEVEYGNSPSGKEWSLDARMIPDLPQRSHEFAVAERADHTAKAALVAADVREFG